MGRRKSTSLCRGAIETIAIAGITIVPTSHRHIVDRWPSPRRLYILAAMSDPAAGRRLGALIRKFRRARALSFRGALAVVRAFGWIAIIRLGVRFLHYPALVAWLDRGLPRGGPAEGTAAVIVKRSVTAVDIAARNSWPRPKCLARSLALRRMLRAAGIPAEMKIGVARPGDGFEAHAWVEVEGRVVNDAPDIATRFRPLEAAADLLRLRLRDVASRRFDRCPTQMENRP